MKHLAITGNLGSGKSTVCKIFEALQIPIYYSDVEAKRLMLEDEDLKNNIKALIGFNAYHENGALNRTYISGKIFENKIILEKMNGLVHPAVRVDYLKWRKAQNAVFTIQESALTFEIGAEKIMDAVILVYAPEPLLIERGMLRDNKTEAEIKARLSQQINQEIKKKKSEFIVYNGLGDSLCEQVVEMYCKIID